MAHQLALDLPHWPALGREDFLVSEANAAAAALIDAWPNWPSHAAVLIGPAGSGKTHLSEVWRLKSDATPHTGNSALPHASESFARLVEDMPGAINDTALFHLLNLAREQGGHVLITSRTSPGSWNVVLPDLASRLQAATVIHIGPPDDALLRAVVVKQFADRQLAIDDSLVSYILARMPRSLAAARAIVMEIDQSALERHAEVTKPFVSDILRRFSEPEIL
jgi:chromosomal replication initiation ATPase DnaA